MENTKCNIAKILKNAPKGLELYSPLFGKCNFVAVVSSTQPTDDFHAECIHVKYRGKDWYFNEYGECFYENSECLLFPSQSHRTWNIWQTELLPKSVGSVVELDGRGTKFIVQKSGRATTAKGLYLCVKDRTESCNLQYCDEQDTEFYMRLLNEHGKMWSSSKGAIVLISDKYKKGDKLFLTNRERHTDMIGCADIVFDEVDDIYSSVLYYKRNRNDDLYTRVKVTNEELVNDFVNVGNDLETPTFKDVVTEGMKVADEELCNYTTFTIEDFKPFDKVLVRNESNDEWVPNFFSRFIGPYCECMNGKEYVMCIPYDDDTKWMQFTRTNYEGKYKTWK